MIKAFIPFLSLLLFLSACNECNDEVVCRGISNQAVNKLPFRDVESLTFTNGADSTIVFYRNDYYSSPPEVKDCYKVFSGGCQCPSCDSPFVFVHFESEFPVQTEYEVLVTQSFIDTIGDSTFRRDTTFTTYKTFSSSEYAVSVRDNESGNELSILVQFYDFNNSISINIREDQEYEISLSRGDSLLSTYETPHKTYQNIVKMYSNNSRMMGIEEVYYSIEYGVVAFYDENAEDYFYRSDL